MTNRDSTPGAHPAQDIQTAQNLGVAPEKHRRIRPFKRSPAPIRGPVRVIWWGSSEMLGTNPEGAQTI